MLIKSISFPTYLEDITDIENSNIDVFVELEDAYWLKLYHFAGKVDTAVFNQLQAEHMEYLKKLDELDNS